VERRAARLREDMVRHRTEPDVDPRDLALRAHALPGVPAHLLPIGRLVSHVISRPLLPGNRIEPLVNGEHAYPAMLAAIDAAQQSVGLASYIFHGTSIGAQFVEGFNALSSVAWRYVLWSTMSMPASLDGQP
jgi:cardiolipin synthase